MGSEFLRIKIILDKIPATEDETRMISEVLAVKTSLVKGGDESVMHEMLKKLQRKVVSVKILEATGIGKSVNDLQNHSSKDIKQIARMLIGAWRRMVDEWMTATDSMPAIHQEDEEGGGESNKKQQQVNGASEVGEGGGESNKKPTSRQQLPKVISIKLKKVQVNSEKEESPDGPMTPDSQKVKKINVATRVYTQGVAEVLRIKGILNKCGDELVVCDLLNKLQVMGLSVATLEATGIGKTVGALRKHASKDVCRIAWTLIKEWKGMVKEWMARESSVVTAVSQKAKNPDNDEEEGKRKLHEPKLQPQKRLKFQTMVVSEKETFHPEVKKEESTDVKPSRPSAPVKTKKFQNPTKSNVPSTVKLVKPEATKRKLQEIKLQHQKELKSQSMSFPANVVKNEQSTAVKPNKPSASVEARKFQIPTKQTAPVSSLSKTAVEEKLKTTKRKLQQGYKEAQNMKKLRRTQVLEVHDVLRLGLAPKHVDSRFGKRSSRCVGLAR